jgi:hypothetical protein
MLKRINKKKEIKKINKNEYKIVNIGRIVCGLSIERTTRFPRSRI